MNNLLSVVAVILVISWLVGFFAFHEGGIIHVLLVIAEIVILLRAIHEENYLAFSATNKIYELYKVNVKSYNTCDKPAAYLSFSFSVDKIAGLDFSPGPFDSRL